MPISLTEQAAREVGTLLAGQGKAGAMLRVWVAGAGCGGLRYGLGIDDKEPEKDDTVFDSNGVRVVIDPQSLSFMDGSTVKWVDDGENSGFDIENPNPPPVSDCNCGAGDECGAGDGCGEGEGCGSPESADTPKEPKGRSKGGSCCGGS